MEKSCDVYSESAFMERQKAHDADRAFEGLSKSVHRTLTAVPRPANDEALRRLQGTARRRPPPRPRPRAVDELAMLVVRPAPYPVKNYILPAQHVVGPRRYYRSRAGQRRRDEERETAEERVRFAGAFETPPPGLEMIVTATQALSPRKEPWLDDEEP